MLKQWPYLLSTVLTLESTLFTWFHLVNHRVTECHLLYPGFSDIFTLYVCTSDALLEFALLQWCVLLVGDKQMLFIQSDILYTHNP